MRRCVLLRYLSLPVFFFLCLSVYKNLEEPEMGMSVEDDALPKRWTLTPLMKERIRYRNQHLEKVCHKYGLDKPSPLNELNTNEFLVNKEHGLVWCNVFKAASSTWFWNFNLLAGYTEEELMKDIRNPMVLARRRYPRPNAETVRTARSDQRSSIAFMIARHPFRRLVSGFRDKLLSKDKSYRYLRRYIMDKYPELASEHPQNWISPLISAEPTPSFNQFVQYLIDQHDHHKLFDIHWRPMNELCSPCLNNFDMIAKVETLKEDSNYIIFTSGIEDYIKPKIINKSKGTNPGDIADNLLCQVSHKQILELASIYKLDLELFEYDISEYLACTENNEETIT